MSEVKKVFCPICLNLADLGDIEKFDYYIDYYKSTLPEIAQCKNCGHRIETQELNPRIPKIITSLRPKDDQS